MARFVVVVQEEHHLEIEAESEAQIREWFTTLGPGSLQRRGATLELHDRILECQEST